MLSKVNKLNKLLAQKSVVPSTYEQPAKLAPIPLNKNVVAKIDSGASKNYFRECNIAALKSVKAIKGPMVIMPDNNGIQIKHQGQLPLSPKLVGPVTLAYVLSGLKKFFIIVTSRTIHG